jgi:hypothetical protein
MTSETAPYRSRVALAVSTCILAVGCAPRFAVNGHNATPDEYDRAMEQATQPQAGRATRTPPACEVAAADTNFATIRCRYAGSPSLRDWRVGIAAEMKLAAQTAIIAGKTAVASVSRATPDVRTASYTTPRACATSVNGLRAFGVVLGGMSGAYQDRIHCSSSGSNTDCSVTPAQSVPDVHDTTCVGGRTTSYVSYVITNGTWRFLTEQETGAPAMALLPREKRPIPCEVVLSPDFSLTRTSVASHKTAPEHVPASQLPQQPPEPSREPDTAVPTNSNADGSPPSKEWADPFAD